MAVPAKPAHRRGDIRRVLTILLIAGLVAAAPYTAQARKPAQITMNGPKWVPGLIRRLAMCETHGNPHHRAGSYEGIVGWYSGTWDLDKPNGYPDHAYQATLEQQVVVAIRSVARGRYFGCLHGAAHGWVRG